MRCLRCWACVRVSTRGRRRCRDSPPTKCSNVAATAGTGSPSESTQENETYSSGFRRKPTDRPQSPHHKSVYKPAPMRLPVTVVCALLCLVVVSADYSPPECGPAAGGARCPGENKGGCNSGCFGGGWENTCTGVLGVATNFGDFLLNLFHSGCLGWAAATY